MPSTAAAAASSPARMRRRPAEPGPRVDASPWVRHSMLLLVPALARAASMAPRPKDSSSGWAQTARTRVRRGSSLAGGPGAPGVPAFFTAGASWVRGYSRQLLRGPVWPGPPAQPVLLECDLGQMPLRSGAAEPDLRAAWGVEVACGERCPPVAELDEAGAVAVEGGGGPAPGQLGGDVAGCDLGLGLGEYPGLGQELPAGQRDGGDIADRVHPLGAGRQRCRVSLQEPGLAREAAGGCCLRRTMGRYAEQQVVADPLPPGQGQLAGRRVDPLDHLAQVKPDAPLREHAREGVAEDGTGGGH